MSHDEDERCRGCEGLSDALSLNGYCLACEPPTKDYCTQNHGDCATCSLKNYGRDCRNQVIKSILDAAEAVKIERA